MMNLWNLKACRAKICWKKVDLQHLDADEQETASPQRLLQYYNSQQEKSLVAVQLDIKKDLMVQNTTDSFLSFSHYCFTHHFQN